MREKRKIYIYIIYIYKYVTLYVYIEGCKRKEKVLSFTVRIFNVSDDASHAP